MLGLTRRPAPPVGIALLALLPGVSTCVFPTDESEVASVVLTAPASSLVRGNSLIARARALRPLPGGGSRSIEAVSFKWSSDDPGVATVTPQPDGSAVVSGVNVGRVSIRATAEDFDKAEPGELLLRVTNTVEIDSVVPDTVRYGEQVDLYGIGLGRVTRVTLGDAALIADSASFAGDSAGEAHQRFWVPFPARTGQVLAVASEGFSAPAAERTVVLPVNAYRTPDGSAATINLDGPPILPGGVLFHNPALAITPEVGEDVFYFNRTDTTKGMTIVVATSSPAVTNIQPIIAPPGDPTGIPLRFEGWTVGVARQFCRGSDLISSPDLELGSDSARVIRSLQVLPGRTVSLRISGESPGRYEVTVLDGYVGTDPRITPDRFEENDYCTAADINAENASTQLDITAGVNEVLTIDQPYDVDWYRFDVPLSDQGLQLVTIRTAALPFAAADSSNLGLGLISDFDLFDDNWTAESHEPGSSERISLELEEGIHYLAVFDEAGVPTRYSLCIQLGNDCVPPAAP